LVNVAKERKNSQSPTDETDAELLFFWKACRNEAEEAKRTRMARNRLNWDMYYGYQDYSHKQEGQSTEFLPKMANAAENMRAMVKRALVQFGDWFSVEVPKGSPLTPEQVRGLMRRFLDRVVTARNKTENFATLMGKATLQGLFESLIILKVHGYSVKEQTYKVEPGDMLAGIAPVMKATEEKVWRLRIDLIPTEDYFPDPTGRNLYEIHEVERDYADVMAMAEAGVYDKKEVEKIGADFTRDATPYRRLARHRGQNETTPPKLRRRVRLSEFWGTLLDRDGEVIAENILMTVANEKYIIRQPEPNPLWHKESPIVRGTLISIPHAVWGKALYDHTAQLNIALNELFNLILDGGISSVWGVREVRTDYLQDPRQISNGIQQGSTLLLNADVPADGKAVQITATGKVPPDALAVLNLASREHDASAMTNDTRMGFLPQRQVKATEINAADQSHSMLLDSFAGDIEAEVIEPVLRKAWLTILQYADDLDKAEVIDVLGVPTAFTLSRMSEGERFAMFAKGMKFKVHGLSSTLARARDFQKLMAYMQAVQQNPMLMESFMRKMDADKANEALMRMLNINPENFELTEEQQAQVADRMKRMAALQQIAPSGGGSPPAASGGPSEQAGINQAAEPTGGF
jgi:hypothetical protein